MGNKGKEHNAWRITLIAIFAGLAIAIIQNKVVPCIGLLQEVFAIGAGTAGWLSSVFCVMGIVMAFPGAAIVEKLGLKAAGLLSLAFGLLGTFIGVAANSVSLLMFSRVLEGMGAGIIAIVVPSIITRLFPADRRGLPMSIWSTWQIVAQSLCFLCVLPIALKTGWRGVWIAGGIVLVAATLLYALFVNISNQGAEEAEEDRAGRSIVESFRNPSMWLICIAMFFFTFGNFGFVTWVATAWAEKFSLLQEVTNNYISVMYLFALPISILFGFVLNRVNHKRFGIVSYFLYAVVSAASFLLPDARFILPYIVLYPVVESALCAVLWTLVPETVRDERDVSVAMALFGLLQNVGMLLGPPFAGMIYEERGFFATALAVGVPALIGTALLAGIKTEQEVKE